MLKVSVIILTYNSEKTIEALLNSLSPFKSSFEITVVDNKSGDKTVQKVKKFGFVKLIKNKKNLGFSAGNNVGIKYALKSQTDVVLLLNPDTVVPKTFLKNFEESTLPLLENSSVGIVGPKIYDEKGMLWSVGGKLDEKRYSAYLIGYGKEDLGQFNFDAGMDYISATAIFIKKEVFEKIGKFTNDYFLYYEDVDFCQRALRARFKLIVDPNISIIHNASSSVGKNSPVMQYYMARNHMLFLERFAPLKIKLQEFIRLPKTLYQARGRKYEILGIADYFLRRFGKSAYWG